MSESGGSEPLRTTLLDLVYALSEGRSDAEVVEIVTHLIRRGRIRLTGNFRDAMLDVVGDVRADG